MGFAAIDGVTLNFRLSGSGDGVPLVLANSLGTDLRIWDELVPALALHRAVLSYDKRGHGLSDTPPGPYSLNDHSRDLLGLAARAGFERFAICGISIGGMIAMQVAAQQPDRVAALVLCDAAASIGTAESWRERIAAVEAGGMPSISETLLSRWLSPGHRAQHPTAFAGWRNMLDRCPADGYTACCATVRDANLSGLLTRIVAPTLVVAGEHDVVTPPEVAQALAANIQGARFELLRGSGHVPAIEQPRALASLIQSHLSEVLDA
ncbi:MAG: 3-oxoadipate enol-lactonase [Devosia sp.]